MLQWPSRGGRGDILLQANGLLEEEPLIGEDTFVQGKEYRVWTIGFTFLSLAIDRGTPKTVLPCSNWSPYCIRQLLRFPEKLWLTRLPYVQRIDLETGFRLGGHTEASIITRFPS